MLNLTPWMTRVAVPLVTQSSTNDRIVAMVLEVVRFILAR